MNSSPDVLMSGDKHQAGAPAPALLVSQARQVAIRKLGRGDEALAQEIVALFAEGLGNGFITPERIEAILREETNLILMGGFSHGGLVAVQTVSVLTEEEVQHYQAACLGNGGVINFKGQRVGILVSFVVRKSFRRKGIGSQMLGAAMGSLAQKGCTICISTAWNSESVEASSPLFEAAGFRHVTTFKNHWTKESLTQGYNCPTCGPPPCQCSASFYAKPIGAMKE